MNPRRLAALAVFIAVFSPAFAAEAPGDWRRILPSEFRLDPPPERGGEQERKDLAVIRAYQLDPAFERMRKDGCDFGNRHLTYTYETFYTGFLSADRLAKTKGLLTEVAGCAAKVVEKLKDQYDRPRPFKVDPEIQPCIPLPPATSTAYPSGHATFGATTACVLADLYPNEADEILRYGRYIGDYRVIVGVHYPSDVDHGEKLGRAICRRLLDDEGFQAELRAIR